jgi:hypothetical protein
MSDCCADIKNWMTENKLKRGYEHSHVDIRHFVYICKFCNKRFQNRIKGRKQHSFGHRQRFKAVSLT